MNETIDHDKNFNSLYIYHHSFMRVNIKIGELLKKYFSNLNLLTLLKTATLIRASE
jgi:hypothetical protein